MNKIAFLIGLSVQEEIKRAVGTIQNGQLYMNFVRVREGPFEEVRYILRPEGCTRLSRSQFLAEGAVSAKALR